MTGYQFWMIFFFTLATLVIAFTVIFMLARIADALEEILKKLKK